MSPSPDLTLFYLENSRAFRVAWLLEHLSLPYTLKQFRRIEGKRAEPTLRSESSNPLGKSPYLTDGDVQIGESSAIVKYLITRYASAQERDDLLGSTSNWSESSSIDSFISFSEGMMIHTLAVIYPRWFSTPEIAKDIEAGLSANIHNNLNFLEESLSKPNANGYLVGGRLTAADIMCAFTAEYTFHMDTGITSQGKKKEDWPKTVEWLKGLSRLESYQKVLSKGVAHKFTISDE